MNILTYTLCIIGACTVCTLTIMIAYEIITQLIERIFHHHDNDSL